MGLFDEIGQEPEDDRFGSFDMPERLFDTGDEGLTDLSSLKQHYDPLKKFKQPVDGGYSSKRQPHTGRAFREYDTWLKTGELYKSDLDTSKKIKAEYDERLKQFREDFINPHYLELYGIDPVDKDDTDRSVREIEDFYKKNPEALLGSNWGKISEKLAPIRENQAIAEERYNVASDIKTDFDERNMAVDPAFRRAFENRSKTAFATKGSKLGANSKDDWNEFFEAFSVGTDDSGNLSGFNNWGKYLMDDDEPSIMERILGEAEYSALMEEHRRGEWLPGNGFEIPPSLNGKIADISTRLRNRERSRLLLKKARDAGITHFVDEDGTRHLVDDDYFALEEFDEEDDERLVALDNYFKAKGTHNQALMEFFANRSKMTPEEEEKAIEKNQFLNQLVQESAIQLEAMGMVDEAVNRSESLEELGRFGSWWRTGALQAELSSIAKEMMITGGQLDQSTLMQLVDIVQQQDELEEYKMKKGYSPLAEINKMSQEEGSEEGWLDALGKWFGNPQAMIQTATESLASLLPAYLDTAPEVVGATALTGGAIGSVVPGAGTLAGAGAGAKWGLRINYGVASFLLETTGKVIESMRELGIDPENPQHYAMAWANPDLRDEIRIEAAKKGIPIFLMDTLAAGMAGKVNAVVKSPGSLKKIPSVLPGGKKYFKGLNDKFSDELMELKKLQKAKKLDDDGLKRLNLLDKQRKANLSLIDQAMPTQSALGRSLSKANKNVHRYTKMDRAKAAGLEMGAQMAFGAGGEAAGQLWAREPGDPIDKHAVFGEMFGELGGLGTATSAYEIAGHRGKFWEKPENRRMVGSGFETTGTTEVAAEEGNEYAREGLMHNINRSGWQHTAFQGRTATDYTAYIAEQAGVPVRVPSPDPAKQEEVVNPQLQALNEYVGGVMNLMRRVEGVGDLKVVIDSRTPENSDGVGYTEIDPDTGDFYVYLNPNAAEKNNDNIFGAAIHEFPHILGKGVYGDAQVEEWYSQLTKAQKDQALAHYLFKDDRAHADFSKPGVLTPEDLALMDKARSTMSRTEMAQEWFAFEVARILLGQLNDKRKKVKVTGVDLEGERLEQELYTSLPPGEYNNILSLLDQNVFQPYQKYIGSGVRRQAPQTFGQGIENTAAQGIYQAPPGAGVPGSKPMVSSDVSMRPEKMGEDEMYARILRDMQWMVDPNMQITWVGPDKFIERTFVETDLGRLQDQRNKLIGNEQYVRRLEKIAGMLPQDTLSLRSDFTKKTNAFGEEEGDKLYEAQATDTRTKEEVESFVEQEMRRQEQMDQDSPYQEAGRIREAQAVEEEIDTEIDTGIDVSDDVQTTTTGPRTRKTNQPLVDPSKPVKEVGTEPVMPKGETEVPGSTKTETVKGGRVYKQGGKLYTKQERKAPNFKGKQEGDVVNVDTSKLSDEGRDRLVKMLEQKLKTTPDGSPNHKKVASALSKLREFTDGTPTVSVELSPAQRDELNKKGSVLDKPKKKRSGYDPADDVGPGLGLTDEQKKRFKENLYKEAGVESVDTITGKMDKLYAKLQKQGMSQEEIMKTADMQRLVQARSVSRRLEGEIDKTVQKKISAMEKEAKVEPGQTRTARRTHVVKEGDTMRSIAAQYKIENIDTIRSANRMSSTAQIEPGQKLIIPTSFREEYSDEALAQRAITDIEKRRREFKAKHGDKSPEEQIASLWKLIKSADDSFIEQTRDIVEKLKENKGRVTAEEFIAEVARSYGLDDMADSFKEARSRLSNRTDIQSIEEAYYTAEAFVGSAVTKLELLEADTIRDIEAEQAGLQKSQGTFEKLDTQYQEYETEITEKDGTKKKVKKKRDSFTDEQAEKLIEAIKRAVVKRGHQKEKLGKVLTIKSEENRQSFLTKLEDLVEREGVGILDFISKKKRLNTGDVEKDAANAKILENLTNMLYKGAISGVKKELGDPKVAAKQQAKIKRLRKTLKKLQDLRTSQGIGSLTQQLQWKNQKVVGSTMYNYYKKEGKTYVPVVLGDMIYGNRIDVYQKKGDQYEKLKGGISNPAKKLQTLINENMTPEAMAKWGQQIPGQNITYGDYATTLMLAGASMRNGNFQMTEKGGTIETPYFEADVGANIAGALTTRVEALMKNTSQISEEEISNRKLDAEQEQILRDFKSMSRYHAAFDEQLTQARSAREGRVKNLKEERKKVLNFVKESNPQRRHVQGLKLVINNANKMEERTEFQNKILEEMKAFNSKTKVKTLKTVEDFLESKGLSLDAIEAVKDQEVKLPVHITAEDRIIINMAATQMAYDHFGRDTGKVGSQVQFDRFRNDYELSIEAELDANIDHLQGIVDTGMAPTIVAVPGQTITEGEYFRSGTVLRKAFKTFTFRDINQVEALDQVSRITDPPREMQDGMIKIGKAQLKRVKSMLDAAKKVRVSYTTHMFGWDNSDVLAAQPKINFNDGTPVSYKHWLRDLAAKRWQEGPGTFDKPWGAYPDNYRPVNYGVGAKSHKNPNYVDEAWVGRTVDGKPADGNAPIALNSQDKYGRPIVTNFTDAEYKAFQKRIAENKATAKDIAVLKAIGDETSLKALQNLSIGNSSGGRVTRQIAWELNNELQRLRDANLKMPEDIRRELNYDEVLDKPVNVAQKFIAAVLMGRQSLPVELRSVRYESETTGDVLVEDDMKKILRDPVLRKLFLEQNKHLAHFDFHYDNLESKSDPVFKAINTVEVNDIVRKHLDNENRERDVKERAGHVTALTKANLEQALNKANFEGRTEEAKAIQKVIDSGQKIVYTDDLQEFRMDRRPRFRLLSNISQLLDSRDISRDPLGKPQEKRFKTVTEPVALPGDEFMMYVSKDGAEPTQHKVTILKTPEKIEGFEKEFEMAEMTGNLYEFLQDKGIIKLGDEISENPIEFVSSFGPEARAEIARKKRTLKRMRASDLNAFGLEGVQEQAQEVLQDLEDRIERAVLWVNSKGKEGAFEFEDVNTDGQNMQTRGNGAWGAIDKNKQLTKLDAAAQRGLDHHWRDIALANYDAYQDELNGPFQAIRNLSSFIVTPRKLGQFMADHEIGSVNMLAGSHSQYKAETRGGIELLKFLPEVVDEMLDSLSQVSKAKKLRISRLIEVHKGTEKEEYLQNYLDALNDREKSLQDLPVSTQVLLDHISVSWENHSRTEKKPKFITDADITAATALHRKEKDAFSIAIAQGDPPVYGSRIINLGTYEEESTGFDGKPRKETITMRVLMTPHFVEKDGSKVPVKMTQKEYLEQKASTRTESLDVVDPETLIKVGKKRDINIEPVANRWPVNPANKEESLSAYVYDLKFLNSAEEVSSAYLELARETYDRLKANDKLRMEEFYSGLEDLKIAFDPETGAPIAGAERKAAELGRQMRENRERMNEIQILFETSVDHRIPKNIETASVKYPGEKKAIDLKEAKLRTLARLVFAAGGIKHDTAEDVRLHGIERDNLAAEAAKGGDMSGESFDPDSYESQQDFAGGISNQDLIKEFNEIDNMLQNQSEGLFTTGFQEGYIGSGGQASSFNTSRQGPGFLSRLASRFGWGDHKLRERVKNGEDPHGDKFFKTRFSKDKNILGFDIPGSWSPTSAFLEQFAALEDSFPAIAKGLGIDPQSPEGERMNVYSEAYATMGRTGEMMDTANREYVDPVLDAMNETKIDRQDLGEYLIALATPVANKAIANNRKNQEGEKLAPLVDEHGNDNGSGLSNAEAKDMKERLEKLDTVQAFINHPDKPLEKIFQVHEKTLDLYAQAGSIDQDQYKKMKAAATDEKGRFRRLPLKGMHWLEGDQWEVDRQIADRLGGETRAQGKGFDQPRKDGIFNTSMGRKNGYADPLGMWENVVSAHQQAVIQSQRARPAMKLLEIHNRLKEVRDKDPESYGGKLYNKLFAEATELTRYDYKNIEDDQGNVVGKIKQIVVPENMNDAKLLFFVRNQGVPIMIKFARTKEGASLAAAAKNLDHEKMGTLMEILSTTTQGIAKIVTKWNPEFWLRNPVRDTSAVWFNLGDSEQGKKLRNKILGIPGFGAKKWSAQVKAIAKYENYVHKHGKLPKELQGDIKPSELDRERIAKDPMYAYHAMKSFGGKTAFYLFKSVDALQKEMTRKIKKGSKGSKWNPMNYINPVVENINVSLENAYRARTFAEFIADGAPIERAIREARNVTIDFNKRGRWSRQLGSFILFANPTLQGTKRFWQAFARRSMNDRLLVSGQIFATAFAWNLIARSLSERDEDEEDDGRTYYDDRGNQKNFSSIGIPMDMFKDEPTGSHLDIPLDFAWTPIVGLASILAKHTYHSGNDKFEPNLVEDLVEYMEYSLAAMAPIPTAMAPPALVPVADVVSNQKSFGGMPVYNEGSNFAPYKSPEMMSTKKTSEIYKSASKFINRVGGGDKYKPGNWAHAVGQMLGMEVDSEMDLKDDTFKMGPMASGAVLQYLVEQYTGGMGEIVGDVIEHAVNPDKKAKKKPLINALYKSQTNDWPTIGRYYDLKERNRLVDRSISDWNETGQKEKAMEYRRKYPQAAKLQRIMSAAEKNVRALRRRQTSVENNKLLTEAQKMQRLEDIEKMRINTMRKALVKAHQSGIAI